MKVVKEKVTYYRMHTNDLISSIFTDFARKRIYYTEIDNGNRLYYFKSNGKKEYMPFNLRKELFIKCELNLYPIGTQITNKSDMSIEGEILYYDLENNRYVIKTNGGNKHWIYLDNAIVVDTYYFISSSGKVQRDFIGRDKAVEDFRKRTNNYFENKELAVLALNLMLSK